MIDRRALIAGLAAALPARAEPTWREKLVDAAERQVGVTLLYDPAYRQIAYPGGDIPRLKGVCCDVVIRAYRDAFDLDLQKLVHEDMKRAFAAYPRTWGLKRPDPNIDHRRVPNLETFLTRRGASLPLADYQPGDIVTQRLPGNLPHILLVAGRKTREGRPLAVHNIGWGTRVEDALFDYPLHGHFRFAPMRA